MAHPDQLQFFELARAGLPAFFAGRRVLEVGSLDINGSIRQVFDRCEYVGLDVGAGPGVDVVVGGQDYDEPDGSFDVVVSAECMEHNPEWEATVRNMLRLLRPGGLFLLTCAAPGRPEHGTIRSMPGSSPLTVALGQSYYRNLYDRDFRKIPEIAAQLPLRQSWMNWATRDFYLVGIKGPGDRQQWMEYVKAVSAWIDTRNPMFLKRRIQVAMLAVFGKRFYEMSLPLVRLRVGSRDGGRVR